MPEIGEFEQVLLLALARCGGEEAGGEVRREIERRNGRSVAPGAVYTAMDRLERRGFVTSRLGEPLAVRGGRRRRIYRLEPAGARAVAEAHRRYLDLAEDAMAAIRRIAREGGPA